MPDATIGGQSVRLTRTQIALVRNACKEAGDFLDHMNSLHPDKVSDTDRDLARRYRELAGFFGMVLEMPDAFAA